MPVKNKRSRKRASLQIVMASAYGAVVCFFAMTGYCAQFHHLDEYTNRCAALDFVLFAYAYFAARWVENHKDVECR